MLSSSYLASFFKAKPKTDENNTGLKWAYAHQLSTVLFTRSILLGPIERMKLILQTKHMTLYANPKSDMPSGAADLIGKISNK